MTSRARIFRAAILLVLGAACGGRTLKGVGGDAAAAHPGNDATGAAGATTGAAGTTSTTSTTGAAGTTAMTGAAGSSAAAGTTATTGQGGVTGAAGAAACGPCPPVDCKPGFAPMTDPAISCCAICRPVDCSNVVCPATTCPPDNHLEMVDGACCQSCLPGTVPVACMKGRASYAVQSKQLIEKYNSVGCKRDGECALVYERNACALSCGYAVPASLANSTLTTLNAFGTDCGTCPGPMFPPCPVLAAFCSNGQCVLGAASDVDAGATFPPDGSAPGCEAVPDQDGLCNQAGRPGLHLFRCVAPYRTPDHCLTFPIANVTDSFCCP